ncbi:unnamed protein product [Triticum turgidum subsp. durum]|uniref:AB hydrolase-1 domain-containing protein n=1 Tax=Triticum turgidum subsp. durum TaxID=4567 RepID=A0A9R1PPB7_TRITD|nr:unnamed protein product [Triticum turgidum subsp. durum]
MATFASVLTLPRLSISPTMPARASPTTTMTRRTRPLRAACAYTLQEGQSRRSHRLPCGLDLEVIAQQPPSPAPTPGRSERPPLVFVHGSFHAAWCWAERWLPFFSRAGFPCFALSLRAQGESSIPSDTVAGTLETHTGDIADFIRKEVPVPPILIGHSFGGLIVQQYISCLQVRKYSYMKILLNTNPKVSIMYHIMRILLNQLLIADQSGLVWRYLLTKPIAAIKSSIYSSTCGGCYTLFSLARCEMPVTLSLAAKAYANSLPLCKETFFSSQMDDELVLRYQNLMKESSKLPLFDLRKLNASLPVPSATDGTLEILVMGASNDFIVDAEGLSETARFYNVQPVCVEGVAHDLMLDCSWENGAAIILSWLDKLAPRSA